MKRYLVVITILALVAVLAAGCAELPSMPTPTSPTSAGMGTLEVRVTDDPPGYEIEEIWVKVSEEEGEGVAARSAADGEWETIDIIENNNPFELTELEDGLQTILAMAPVPAGKYTQIRMNIEWVKVTYTYLEDGEEQVATDVEAIIPSGNLKFVRPFDVVEGETTTLLLDFIANKSVAITGATQSEDAKVIFKPVVKLSIEQGGKGKPNKLGYSLDTTGNATAELYTEEEVYIYSGEESIHLLTSGDVEDGDEARIVIPLPDGTTLGDIDSISWWEYNVAGYPPHVDIVLDVDGEDRLVFEYAYNDHYAEGGPTYGAETDAWYQTFSDDGNGPAQVDDSALGWLASGPPGPPEPNPGNFGTLGNWKDPGITYGSVSVSEATPAIALEIEIDNWIAQTEAYVDDIVIVIAGVTYTVGL